MIQCNITRVSFTRESKSSVWPPGIESPAKSLEMEEGSMDPEPLLCPAPLLLVSPGGIGGGSGGGVGLIRGGSRGGVEEAKKEEWG